MGPSRKKLGSAKTPTREEAQGDRPRPGSLQRGPTLPVRACPTFGGRKRGPVSVSSLVPHPEPALSECVLMCAWLCLCVYTLLSSSTSWQTTAEELARLPSTLTVRPGPGGQLCLNAGGQAGRGVTAASIRDGSRAGPAPETGAALED